MNAADLARLELAKRAYRATEPNAAEVQRGVRKARLGLQRPRARSTWLTKTAVAFVLTMGGLAFASPQVVGELVQNTFRSEPSTPKRGAGNGLASAPVAPVQQPASAALNRPVKAAQPAAPAALALPAAAPEVVVEASKPSRPLQGAPVAAQPAMARNEAPVATNAPAPPSKHAASAGAFPDANANNVSQPQHVSDWGRVGSALANGDETRALAVLNELSESDDRRTRDKADLGRAQLMMSSGNRDQACATARSLTNRGAGSRIERQAQVLLKGCGR